MVIIDKTYSSILNGDGGVIISKLIAMFPNDELFHAKDLAREYYETTYKREFKKLNNAQMNWYRANVKQSEKTQVIILCNFDKMKDAYRVANMYNINNDMKITFVDVFSTWKDGLHCEKFEPIGVDLTVDETKYNRRIVEVWSKAIGWKFKQPLFYSESEYNIDEHDIKRYSVNKFGTQYYAQLNEIPNIKLTERDSDTLFQLKNAKTIVPNKEIEAFMVHFNYLKDNNLLDNEYLEPNYEICDCCGNPRHRKMNCLVCDAEGSDKGFEDVSYEFLETVNNILYE